MSKTDDAICGIAIGLGLLFMVWVFAIRPIYSYWDSYGGFSLGILFFAITVFGGLSMLSIIVGLYSILRGKSCSKS